MSGADVPLPVGDLVESATHELLDGQPNWAANLQVADVVNQQPANVPLVVAALKKRLGHKKHTIGLLAIILLESLVKNAPRNLLPAIASDDFMQDLIRVLPKQIRDPHHKGLFGSLKDYTRDILAVERYDKILLFIDTTSKAFSSRYPIFGECFRQLQRAGTKFPQLERDELAPVVTPPVSEKVLAEQEAERTRARQQHEAALHHHAAEQAWIKRREHDAMVAKFRNPDAKSALETAQVFCDALSQTSPGEDLRRNELVVQIWDALKPQARKLQQQLQTLTSAMYVNETDLAEVLQANDACVEAGLYYEGLVKGTVKRKPIPTPPTPAPAPAPASSSSSTSHIPRAAQSIASVQLPQAMPSSSTAVSSSSVASPAEKRHVPLLQPPPTTAAATPHRKKSAADRTPPAAAVPINNHTPSSSSSSVQQPSFDLLFSAPSPPVPSPAPVAAPVSRSFSSGIEGAPAAAHAPAPAIPPRNKASFALAPPPQAAANVDFFAQLSSPPPTASASAAASSSRPTPIYQTPFEDSPDPFLELATRGSPAAAANSPNPQPPVAAPTRHTPNQPATNNKKKSVVEEFDLLSF